MSVEGGGGGEVGQGRAQILGESGTDKEHPPIVRALQIMLHIWMGAEMI